MPRAVPNTGLTGRDGASEADAGHFAPSVLYAAAKMYYTEDATQAEVAAQLGTSRATVSRLLAEAKRQGIVRIEVVPPQEAASGDLADRLARALGLTSVYLSLPLPNPGAGRGVVDVMGGTLAPAVGRALAGAGLLAGDVLLVSSGRTVYEVAKFELDAAARSRRRTHRRGKRPARGVVPNQRDHPAGRQSDRWPAELSLRARTARAGPVPVTAQRPHHSARAASVAARPVRADGGRGAAADAFGHPEFVPVGSDSLRASVGDVCSRFYDRAGQPVDFEGRERLIAIELEALRHIPVTIAVAVGKDKIDSIIGGALGGYFNQLVTDPATANADTRKPESAR